MVVVAIDVIVTFLFLFAMFRLRYYQDLVVKDWRQGQYRIEDFSVLIKDIPINESDYNNNPELLKAMIVTHLEEIMRNESQVIDEMEDYQEFQDQVVNVHFGLTSQNIMKYLVGIFEEVEKIAKLKRKMLNDPLQSHNYEKDIWSCYRQITQYKDTYYRDKENFKPKIRNAYVTFRSMEGKQRAVQAYTANIFSRIFTELCCCMPAVFKKKKLLKKGYYNVDEPGDPDNIIWEHLGVPFCSKFVRYVFAFLCSLVWFALSYAILWALAQLEKKRIDYIRRDCSSSDLVFFTETAAQNDFQLPLSEQQGFMNCFCQQQYDSEGSAGMDYVFPNGETYCQDWFTFYRYDMYSIYVIGFFLAFMNLFLNLFFDWMVSLVGKPKNRVTNLKCKVLTIFLAQCFNTVIIFMLVFHSFLIVKTRLEASIYGEFIAGPFPEFNERWYISVGTPIVFTLIVMILTPHMGIFFHFTARAIFRCYDRSCTCNYKNTKRPTQDDYEDLYTGPEYILPVRLAQMVAIVYMGMTFSSGLPVLYLVLTVKMFLTYWVDKILLLRYYRLTSGYTRFLTTMATQTLPLAAVVHFLFGFIIFSYPFILNTQINPTIWGESNTVTLGSQYFNFKRMGQHHMLLYFFSFVALCAIYLFQAFFIALVSKLVSSLGSCFTEAWNRLRNQKSQRDYVLSFSYSDDLYCDISYDQLHQEYVRVKRERQMYHLLKMKGRFTQDQIKKHVDSYITIIERNEQSIRRRLVELCNSHIDRIEEIDPVLMTEEQRINTVLEYYNQAVDKSNPNGQEIAIDQSMYGRMFGGIQSYDLMDNIKYKRIQNLLALMNETFGFNEDLNGLISSSITEADFLRAKKSFYAKNPKSKAGTSNTHHEDQVDSFKTSKNMQDSLD
mmetsp:Transcript_14014/g.23808  ORF Transcript_14014/g.23808 Transcript_14014/m.23808 type:complete len:888 (-) Transcript_14014:196-2859(-)